MAGAVLDISSDLPGARVDLGDVQGTSWQLDAAWQYLTKRGQ